jgi:lipoate-protein ligase A
VCFEVPSNYEITADGKKLIGSAQARRKNSLLQHGSLPLHGDLARITQTLAVPDTERQEAAERLLQHATTLEGATGTVHSWNTAVEAFTHGFQSTFGIKFQIADLSEREQQRSQELRRTKYTQREWNHRV